MEQRWEGTERNQRRGIHEQGVLYKKNKIYFLLKEKTKTNKKKYIPFIKKN